MDLKWGKDFECESGNYCNKCGKYKWKFLTPSAEIKWQLGLSLQERYHFEKKERKIKIEELLSILIQRFQELKNGKRQEEQKSTL